MAAKGRWSREDLRDEEDVMALRGAADLAEYIGRNYAGRVVEVGAGHTGAVALLLMRMPSVQVVATDKEERFLGRMHVEKDDIFSPQIGLYRGASLLYSLRPPLELQLAMGDLARRICSDVLIRPLQDEVADMPGFSRRLINSGEARFYLFRPCAGSLEP
jgi:uncharacterized UPF0146 family protein